MRHRTDRNDQPSPWYTIPIIALACIAPLTFGANYVDPDPFAVFFVIVVVLLVAPISVIALFACMLKRHSLIVFLILTVLLIANTALFSIVGASLLYGYLTN